MAKLENYRQFSGRAPVSASIAHALDYQGVRAPHTGLPYSEALLAGVAGGISFGYFIFHYKGYNPQVNILTRNTFHTYGWDAIVNRLRIAQDVINSTNPQKAEEKLIETLEEGLVPIILADVFTLAYEHSEFGENMWAMQPMTVIEYSPESDRALTADRSLCPHEFSAQLLHKARGRVKKYRYRMFVLSPPDENSLKEAVLTGLQETVSLFTEKPPKGSANNFGLKAYEAIINDLEMKGRNAWNKRFTNSGELSSALLTAYKHSSLFWKDAREGSDRMLFRDFLNEAAEILENTALREVGGQFAKAAELWQNLADLLLPESIPELAALRSLMNERNNLFINTGAASIADLRVLDQKIEGAISGSGREVYENAEKILEPVAEQFRKIAIVEEDAISLLRSAIT
ncbi:MAG: BtrH N-terminal domain-containing protein [Salinispira sp.]